VIPDVVSVFPPGARVRSAQTSPDFASEGVVKPTRILGDSEMIDEVINGFRAAMLLGVQDRPEL
jgi:hypothetical protein